MLRRGFRAVASGITFWLVTTIVIATIAVPAYQLLSKARARHNAHSFTKALSRAHAILSALEPIPDALIQRDLRRGLVLLLNDHLRVLADQNPEHPHLLYLQSQVARLNRIPNGFQRATLRCKQARKNASNGFSELAGLIKAGMNERAIDRRNGSLAYASATCAARQIAVETARQAAFDAENMRAYPQALDFAYQAQVLCRKLPPMMREKLTQAVTDDIERLKNLGSTPAKT